MNYKKKMDQRGRPGWNYKAQEIQNVSNLFIQNFPPLINDGAILVPVPPSKMKNDPLYDDRNIQLVANYCASNPGVEFRELITLNKNMTATHEQEMQPEEIMHLLTVDVTVCDPPSPQIVIVDDVLRHGAHYVAIKQLLQPHFQNSQFLGVYIARTRH